MFEIQAKIHKIRILFEIFQAQSKTDRMASIFFYIIKMPHAVNYFNSGSYATDLQHISNYIWNWIDSKKKVSLYFTTVMAISFK